jgi:hypothetical protein
MSNLLLAAVRVLEDETIAPTFKVVASETLLTAVREGLILPTGSAWLLWSYGKANPARDAYAMERLGSIDDADVRQDALATLFAATGGDERDLAIHVLSGAGHALHITDEVLGHLVDRVRTGADARAAHRLIEATHRARDVSSELLRAIRDRFAASRLPEVREVSVAIAAEIAESDLAFVEKLLNDKNADVRYEMAHRLSLYLPGRELALDIIEARLAVEAHPEPRAGLLRAQAELLHSTKRLVQR